MLKQAYLDQARVLVRYLPIIERQGCFALKGGTALNLFHAEVPRLSVDIDLTYRVLNGRDAAKRAIHAALKAIETEALRLDPGLKSAWADVDGQDLKLFLNQPQRRIQSKIEPNLTLRGTLKPPALKAMTPRAQELLGVNAEITVADPVDLYGGKLVAAMDRQHPRDLFDVLPFYDAGQLPIDLLNGFVAYAAASNRPICELLAPARLPLEADYATGFVGMTHEDVTLARLEAVREWLFSGLATWLNEGQRRFLQGLEEQGVINGELIGLPGLKDFPGQQWKALNIRKLIESNSKKHQGYVTKLKSIFGG